MTSLAPRPTSTVLITGGNGSLGSAVALQLIKSCPGRFHLVLTARKPSDERTLSITSALQALSVSFEFQTLDLSSLQDVKSFSAKLALRIRNGDIPPFEDGGVVLSAAVVTYVKDSRTKDGWNEMYGTDVLAQVLLLRELQPVLGGAMVIVIGSAAHGMGVVEYFSAETKENCKKVTDLDGVQQEKYGLGETMKRYGSSKLLLLMASYAMQRRLSAKPGNTIQIASLDPGGMSGDSHLGAQESLVLRFISVLLGVFGPVVRRLKKDAFNPPEVPAKAIASILVRGDRNLGGKYFILDDEIRSSPISLDEKLQDQVWDKICEDLELSKVV